MSVVVGERNLQGYCWHLTVTKFLAAEGLSRSFLGLNRRTPLINLSHVFTLGLGLTPAPRPKDRPLILPQPYETSRSAGSTLCHITSLRFLIRCPSVPFTNLVPDLLQPPTLLLSSAFARAGH